MKKGEAIGKSLQFIENVAGVIFIACIIEEIELWTGQTYSIKSLLHMIIGVLFVYFVIKLLKYILRKIRIKNDRLLEQVKIQNKKKEYELLLRNFQDFWQYLKCEKKDLVRVTDKKEELLRDLVGFPEVEEMNRYLRYRKYDKEVDTVSHMLCDIYYKAIYSNSNFTLMLRDYEETYYECVIMQINYYINECEKQLDRIRNCFGLRAYVKRITISLKRKS